MTDMQDIDYGPLEGLVGVWKGDKGLDVAPEPDGVENNPFYETITFTAIGDVTNAESQVLSAVHYRQMVQRKSNDEVFHHETGYWMWDKSAKIVMHSFVIPRGVCVLAGGEYAETENANGDVVLSVAAGIDDSNWHIIQSPFMQEKARTTEFRHTITVGKGRLSYTETTFVDIYGKVFEHTDQNELGLQ